VLTIERNIARLKERSFRASTGDIGRDLTRVDDESFTAKDTSHGLQGVKVNKVAEQIV
jgi:hypothetical protein